MYLGIDGCRGGWLVAVIDDEQKLSHFLVKHLEDIISIRARLALIDIPLEFADENYRPCEKVAQALLGPGKRSSVFMTPHRHAVFAKSYPEANSLNKLYLGKGMSRQSWNITGKIKEATRFISEFPDFPLLEAHPELCFYFLNDHKPLLSKKAMPEGLADRLKIIGKHDTSYLPLIQEFIGQTKRKDVKPDDVVDATILAIRAGASNIQVAPDNKLIGDRSAIVY